MTSLLTYCQLIMDSNSHRNPTYDVLCTECQSIFDKTAISALQDRSVDRVISPRRLHLTFGALIKSAEWGCHLCNQIFGCLQDSFLYARTNHKESEPQGIDVKLENTQLFTTLSASYLSISGDHSDMSSILWGSLEITPVVCTLVKILGAALK
jgi:hypothetical protein